MSENIIKPDYELIDFGDSEKLERFGTVTTIRPCPQGSCEKGIPAQWKDADLIFNRKNLSKGNWDKEHPGWKINLGAFQMQLKPSPAGQVGIFPEQLKNWKRIFKTVSAAAEKHSGEFPLKILNCFGYTGASTLATAAAVKNEKGEKNIIEITHVDASKAAVKWARENAKLSGLESCTIRWIVEDAPLFIEREIKRKNYYDAVILDPPAFGRGPKGQVWKLGRDLPELVKNVCRLIKKTPLFILATCHAPDFSSKDLEDIFKKHTPSALKKVTSEELTIPCKNTPENLKSGSSLFLS
jgi:23S rRNA (cytosine1962-C5)-methyltransferase